MTLPEEPRGDAVLDRVGPPEASEDPAADHPAGARARTVVIAVVVIAAIAGILTLMGRDAPALLARFAVWVGDLGPIGPVVFALGYALSVVAAVPGSILTLAAGAVFGLTGVLYVFVAASAGAAGAFLVARYLARRPVERMLRRHPRFAALDRALGDQGRKITLLLRLSPVFPFNALNYGLGLTRVSFLDYNIASLGMIPGTFLYVYYGKLIGDVAKVASGAEIEKGAGYWTFLGVGLVATVVVTAIVTRAARQALKKATGEGDSIEAGPESR